MGDISQRELQGLFQCIANVQVTLKTTLLINENIRDSHGIEFTVYSMYSRFTLTTSRVLVPTDT